MQICIYLDVNSIRRTKCNNSITTIAVWENHIILLSSVDSHILLTEYYMHCTDKQIYPNVRQCHESVVLSSVESSKENILVCF